MTIYLSTSIVCRQFSSRQTGEYCLQLRQHHSLLSRICIRLSDSVSHTDTCITPRRTNDRGLGRKPRRSTSLDICSSNAGCAVDSGQHEAEVGRRGTGTAAHGWEVDVEPDTGWKVRLA